MLGAGLILSQGFFVVPWGIGGVKGEFTVTPPSAVHCLMDWLSISGACLV